eukprot:snap_masked-scaffold_43-processed-gene-1.79-mRNA-1 protein AED:1.00 eAED:1.00 QI:0/-1/0/0/-1/1/1/0/62
MSFYQNLLDANLCNISFKRTEITYRCDLKVVHKKVSVKKFLNEATALLYPTFSYLSPFDIGI